MQPLYRYNPCSIYAVSIKTPEIVKTLTLPEALQAAKTFYQNGQLKEAENLCNTILVYLPECQEAKEILAAIPKEIYNDDFYAHQSAGSYRTAQAFFSYLFSFYKPNSLIDFGAGMGTWLQAAHELGIEQLQAIEGEWVKEKVPHPHIGYTFHDLQKPFRSLQKFDLAMSLEVAEHLSAERSESFVQDLCHASDLVMFGAAMKHQGGQGHINEQNQTYWIKQFRIRNYECLDIFRSPFWFRKDLEPWYVQNTFLFLKKGDVRRDLFFNDPLYDVHHPRLIHAGNSHLYQ